MNSRLKLWTTNISFVGYVDFIIPCGKGEILMGWYSNLRPKCIAWWFLKLFGTTYHKNSSNKKSIKINLRKHRINKCLRHRFLTSSNEHLLALITSIYYPRRSHPLLLSKKRSEMGWNLSEVHKRHDNLGVGQAWARNKIYELIFSFGPLSPLKFDIGIFKAKYKVINLHSTRYHM